MESKKEELLFKIYENNYDSIAGQLYFYSGMKDYVKVGKQT